MLLAVTNDLMATAPIENAARQLALPCRAVAVGRLAGLELPASVSVAVLDLNGVDDVVAAVAAIREVAGAEVPIVAFGPHVHEAKLQAASEAGCTKVLTRGQFHRDMVKAISEVLTSK
jgi:hypothetical protein